MPRVYESVVVRAPVEEVWRALRDFHDVSWAGEALRSCEAVGDPAGDRIGARRVLDGAFEEILLGLDDRERTVRYQLTEGPSPVSSSEVGDFVAVIRARPVTVGQEGTFVEWSASWEAGDEAAVEPASRLYGALLEALERLSSKPPPPAGT